jgi:hypothetical protein
MAQLPTTAAGYGLAALFAAMKKVRPERPIHSRGLRLAGKVEVTPAGGTSGIAWIDTPGTSEVTARISRSVGLPDGLPDVVGLALRMTDWPGRPAHPGESGPVSDLLMSSTWWSRPGRFVLSPRLRADRAPLTTIIPYRGTAGPVLVGARTLGPGALPASLRGFERQLGTEAWTLGLFHARPRGSWQRFALLSLRLDASGEEQDLRFDPLLNPLPGADTYGWAARLREPSYAVARRPSPGK